MQTGRILKTGLVVGVVANIYDFVTNTYLFPMLGEPPGMMKAMEELQIQWLVLSDFVAALVLVWVFDKVRGSFGPGAAGGMTFGMYAGVLMHFPTWIVMSIIARDFSYGTAWMWTLTGILWVVIMGTVAGVLYDKMGSSPAASTA